LSEPQPLNAQADRLAAAKAAQSAREAGIKANAVKQGRELERTALTIERHKLEAAHEADLQATKAAHLEEIARLDERWSREEQKHGSGKFWSGVTVGGAIVGALVAVGTSIVINMTLIPTFEAAREARVQDDVVRATERYAAPITGGAP
jgi:hypothetical protein